MCDVEGRLNEWIKLFKNALKGHQTLFINDDRSAESEINKKQDALSELSFSGRHRNHSLWVLTQKYNSVSKDICKQINPTLPELLKTRWTWGGGLISPPF